MKVPHPSEFVLEELEARGWSLDRLAVEMGGNVPLNRLALDVWIAVQEPNCRLGDMADQFGVAFGVSPELFTNLESAWRASVEDATPPASGGEGARRERCWKCEGEGDDGDPVNFRPCDVCNGSGFQEGAAQ